MRYTALATLLVLSLAAPGLAIAPAALSYNLTVTGSYYSGTHPSGAISGTLGGIAVSGTYSHGTWTLLAFSRPFAGGTYECVHICAFMGATLAGRPMAYTLTSQVPTWDARTIFTTGQIAGVFLTRSDWVASVSAWAQANGLPPALRTRMMVDANTGM